jgi:hypothetical protein
VKYSESGDVTELGVWSISSEPDFSVNTDVAIVSRPGVVVPRTTGNIYIRVTYAGLHQSAGPAYAVDPAASPVPLAPYLEGGVSVARMDASSIFLGPGIPDALVEIVDPPSEVGRTDRTDALGFYKFKFLPLDVPITVRVSKAGYVTSIKTDPGITIQPAFGYALNTGLGFELQPIQQWVTTERLRNLERDTSTVAGVTPEYVLLLLVSDDQSNVGRLLREAGVRRQVVLEFISAGFRHWLWLLRYDATNHRIVRISALFVR